MNVERMLREARFAGWRMVELVSALDSGHPDFTRALTLRDEVEQLMDDLERKHSKFNTLDGEANERALFNECHRDD